MLLLRFAEETYAYCIHGADSTRQGTSLADARLLHSCNHICPLCPRKRTSFGNALSSYRLDGSRPRPFGGELHRVAVKVVDVDAGIDDARNNASRALASFLGRLPQPIRTQERRWRWLLHQSLLVAAPHSVADLTLRQRQVGWPGLG